MVMSIAFVAMRASTIVSNFRIYFGWAPKREESVVEIFAARRTKDSNSNLNITNM